ncbi:MAG: U32 family peptidase [Archangiaceae bacterium]|nr:U32 family peptidase [Archangiaceae bacterium]
MPSTPEILAPAGDAESLDAALAAGADAVYLGLDEGLNARARATNFSVASLPETLDHLHRAGARAYVTLNTLVFENELPIVEQLIRACASAGVDGVIVQDPAVALLARAVAPTMEVHASTQMTVSSPEAAHFAKALGITRIVVPRELSVDEVRTFAKGTDLELEVFIHGALCMSWSGQCLTSEAWGGRSANRGQCAQSCRLPYDLVIDGAVRPLGDVAYLLSPMDLAGARAFEALADIGVASLKIEGRLKGPAYVVTAVEGYRRWRDAVLSKQHQSTLAQQQLQKDLGKMAVAYSRGFSDGFFAGSDHQDLVEGRFPKHRGALLGVVAEVKGQSVRIERAERRASGGAAVGGGAPEGATKVALPVIGGASPADARGVPLDVPEPIPGCGVGFDTGRPQEEEPGGPLFGVEPAPRGFWLRFGKPGPDLSRVRPGHQVFLSSDPRLTAEAKSAVDEGAKGVSGRIPTVLTVRGSEGSSLHVTLKATGPVGRDVTVEGQTAELLTKATGAGLGVEVLSDKLGSFGGTPFRLQSIDLDAFGSGLHLPVSSLKALRRSLVTELEAKVLARTRHAVASRPVAAQVVADASKLQVPQRWSPPSAPALIPLVRTPAQLEAVIAAKLPEVELDWMELVGLEKAVTRAKQAGLFVTIATTRVQKPGEEGIDSRLTRLAPDGVLVRHWGGLVHFSKLATRPVVHGDFSLNVTNSVTAHQLLALGCDSLTAAHDLDETQLHQLLANVPAERVTVVGHHHIATFHTEHCVYAHTLSRGRDFRTCGRPCEQHRVALQDREGKQHPVVVDVGCRNTVFNAQAQTAASAVPKLLRAGVKRFRVEFVWEDEATTASVLAGWKDLLSGAESPQGLVKRIAVHEQFGVTAGTMRTLSPLEVER